MGHGIIKDRQLILGEVEIVTDRPMAGTLECNLAFALTLGKALPPLASDSTLGLVPHFRTALARPPLMTLPSKPSTRLGQE